MYKIELSIPAVMSLLVNSTSSSEEEETITVVNTDEEEMSDEDFEKLSESDFSKESEEEQKEEEEEEEDNESLGDDNEEESEEEANEEEPPDSADDDGSEQAEEEEETEGNQPSKEELAKNAEVYEDVYKQLFGSPIKASGREVQLRDVTQVRSLTEMGLDYNKKMQHMRPHMQTLKTLEKEGLLGDEEQLNLLLEAKQGNIDAIRRLISDSNIDMLDLAEEDGSGGYTPGNHLVSENEVEVDEALSAIKATPTFERTMKVMSNEFDAKSKDIMVKNPEYIRSLNSDIETGLYDKVMNMVQYQRDVKAIPAGMSDIEAYIGTVQQMAAQEQQAYQAQANEPAQQEHQPNTRRSSGASRKRKTAMSGSRGSKKKEQKFDPLAAMEMSDDEFMKQYGNKLQ